MKKIILTLGLSALLTMPNLLASDLITTEPLAVESFIIKNHFKRFYIKPFGGIGHNTWIINKDTLEDEHKDVLETLLKNLNIKYTNTFIAGVALGVSINEYTAIESSFSYYRNNLCISSLGTPSENIVLLDAEINIINAIFNPVVSINVTNNGSLYGTAGIGVSGIMIDKDKLNLQVGLMESMAKSSGLHNRDDNKQSDSVPFIPALSWLLGAGVKINITESIELDLGYRYKSLASIADVISLRIHEIHLGMKFNF